LLLCSDGLWGQVSTGTLITAFGDTTEPLAGRLRTLLDTAATHPHSDNVTAVALRWLAAADAGPDSTGDTQVDRAVRHLHSMLEKKSKTTP
jgi:serine/threonine protein phosphatase PrpC